MNAVWNRLAQKRVCFGHQSVGANLIDGLTSVSSGRLAVVESREPEIFRRPVFAHFRVGRNRDPLSKCRDFAAVINSGVGERVDVAFFKLCYVDVTAQTDIHSLFDAYRSVMEALTQEYPGVAFLHVTVPLRRMGGGLLGWMREWAGASDHEWEGQVKRHAYNQLLRAVYGASGRVFDLALEEATQTDGRVVTDRYRGQTVPSLVSHYTYDGGHLNQLAAEHIAGRLLSRVTSIE